MQDRANSLNSGEPKTCTERERESSWRSARKIQNSNARQSESKGKFVRERIMLHRQSMVFSQRQRVRETQRDSERQTETETVTGVKTLKETKKKKKTLRRTLNVWGIQFIYHYSESVNYSLKTLFTHFLLMELTYSTERIRVCSVKR